MMIGECLLDDERVASFDTALRKSIKRGDSVLDAGTGSGIMALIAARYGASKVYAVEIDPDIANIARENVRINNYSEVIEVVTGDVNDLKLGPVDVVVMEMMDTGMIAEQQVPAIRNLRSTGTINSKTKLLPSKFTTSLKFIDYDFEFSSFQLPFILQARNFGVMSRIKKELTHQLRIDSASLYSDLPEHFEYTGVCGGGYDGIANAIVLNTVIELCDGVVSEGTSDLNMPVIVPIKPVDLGSSDVKFKISFTYGHGYGTFSYKSE